MKIYHYRPDTQQFCGADVADQDPMDLDNWLIPANATPVEPPALQEGKAIHFVDGVWVYQDIPVIPPELPEPPTPLPILIEWAKKKVRTMRANAFASLAGIQSEALANGDTKTAKAICGVQDQLRTITDIDLSACKTADDIDAAFASAWLVIVAAAPPAVVSAFNGVQP